LVSQRRHPLHPSGHVDNLFNSRRSNPSASPTHPQNDSLLSCPSP
jgi:hypothetical protein